MSDIVVTVPKGLWSDWLAEGDLPGEAARFRSHFWIGANYNAMPKIEPGERVYIVAHGRLRGFAPLVGMEAKCKLRESRSCLMREGGAVAITIPEKIVGFRGWRYRWWDQNIEIPFPEWKTP